MIKTFNLQNKSLNDLEDFLMSFNQSKLSFSTTKKGLQLFENIVLSENAIIIGGKIESVTYQFGNLHEVYLIIDKNIKQNIIKLNE